MRAVDVCAAVQEAAAELLDVPVEGWRSSYWERDPGINHWRGNIYGGAFAFHQQEGLNLPEISAALTANVAQRLDLDEEEQKVAKLQVSLVNGEDGLRSWINWSAYM